MKSRSSGCDRYSSPLNAICGYGRKFRPRQMPPLGPLNSRALELLEPVERDPVFVDPQRRLQVIARARLLQRLAARPLGLKEKLRHLELRFEPDHVVFGELVVRQPHIAAIHIHCHVEAPQRSRRSGSEPAPRAPHDLPSRRSVRLLPSKLLLAT